MRLDYLIEDKPKGIDVESTSESSDKSTSKNNDKISESAEERDEKDVLLRT